MKKNSPLSTLSCKEKHGKFAVIQTFVIPYSDIHLFSSVEIPNIHVYIVPLNFHYIHNMIFIDFALPLAE